MGKKLKDIEGYPKQIIVPKDSNCPITDAEMSHNQIIQKIGEFELVVDVEKIRDILFSLYPLSYGDDGECQLRPTNVLDFIDGNKISQAISKADIFKVKE